MTLLFAPEQDLATPVVAVVAAAQQQVRVLAYILTLRPLIAALVSRHAAGVDVQVLLDASQAAQPPGSVGLAALQAAGVPVLTGSSPRGALLHTKLIVVDAITTIHGSYNFTLNGGLQSQTCELVRSRARAAVMLTHWNLMQAWVSAHPGLLPTIREES